MIFVTGSAGFIASNFILKYLNKFDDKVLGIDKITYASNIPLLKDLKKNKNFIFHQLDINNSKEIEVLIEKYKPKKIINFAAESHVDKSISNADSFIESNILGTYSLLKCLRNFQDKYSLHDKINDFIFLHVSTDEVFGSLQEKESASTELSQYKPNSPYSASKAASDHLVRSFHKTFNLNTIITHCSNNYGPFQFPEKLIPLIINNCLQEKSLPVYGDGLNLRDWIHVDDHCEALMLLLNNGKLGETYNIGGLNQITNIEVVKRICSLLDIKKPSVSSKSYANLIEFIPDRLGHDRRYSIDISKIRSHTGWSPKRGFEDGIKDTVEWYLSNTDWLETIKNSDFEKWIKYQY